MIDDRDTCDVCGQEFNAARPHCRRGNCPKLKSERAKPKVKAPKRK